MSDVQLEFHKRWLRLVEPVDGLVVSATVLAEAQCMQRQPPELQRRLFPENGLGPALTRRLPDTSDGRQRWTIDDLPGFLDAALSLRPDLFDAGAALPDELSLYVPEGRETLRPTLGLRHLSVAPAGAEAGAVPDDSTPAGRAGAAYVMLVWDLPGVPLDTPDRREGAWAYPPLAKFDRLLRHCRVPIGLLTDREELRLVYAPHGESSGVMTFRAGDMASFGGREILDAFALLLSARRFFGVAPEHQLPRLLRDSRLRQASVTNELAEQVLDALQFLLRGFEAAAERDGDLQLVDALRREPDGAHLYGGLLTVLLRLVFILYAEDRGLLPVKDLFYAAHLSALTLFDQLQGDHGAFPDTMGRRFGAWGRLLALFRAIYHGVRRGDLHLPARHGDLFNPNTYPFLEGFGPAGSAPVQPEDRAAMHVSTVDDGTVFEVLHRLLLLKGQRLSYRALDVEQIGSVYEALMGFQVQKVASAAVCLRPARIWVSAVEVRDLAPTRRAAWLQEEAGLQKAAAQKAAQAIAQATDDDGIVAALRAQGVRGVPEVRAGQLVLQPGPERRRTSSHYTPRSLSEPIVRRTLEPLLLAMGKDPSAGRLLELKVCDPAMGSGAFLVEACRFLADQVVAAWTRAGEPVPGGVEGEDVVLRARRLVAQRCLYGVDRNPFAVSLAKLSLWLVTLARDAPFTFVDHALRHGDSLVGLSLDQLRGFHWQPQAQMELFGGEIDAALEEAQGYRQEILALAEDRSDATTKEKEWLLRDAEYALDRARLIGDVVVGAFFAHEKDKDRQRERDRRLELVSAWLREDGPPSDELRGMQAQIREQVPVFHWMLEFPEVFYAGRHDPLEADKVNEAAYFDTFVGNPPFAGKNSLSGSCGSNYVDWVMQRFAPAYPNADLSAYFLRQCATLIGLHGTVGLITADAISEGDTRATALRPLVTGGALIYTAQSNTRWPGTADVRISIVMLAFGATREKYDQILLNGKAVSTINSRLEARPERDPAELVANEERCFQGNTLVGDFEVSPDEYHRLIGLEKNADCLFEYIGGEELNKSPDGHTGRFVINFAGRSLEQAGNYPDLLRLVDERVRPTRIKNARELYRVRWWLHGEERPGLYEAIRPLRRCIVIPQTGKYLSFLFQETDRVFSNTVFVIAIDSHTAWGVLQSRVHLSWALMLSAVHGGRGNVSRYRATETFGSFPWPKSPLAIDSVLEDIGERLYSVRAKFMLDERSGLTILYNFLKDPNCSDPRIIALRQLHEEMDRAVLAAYGWTDIPVPPYVTPSTPAEERALEAFQDEVIDRLFDLNATMAAAQRSPTAASRPARRAAPTAAQAPLTLTSPPSEPRAKAKNPRAPRKSR